MNLIGKLILGALLVASGFSKSPALAGENLDWLAYGDLRGYLQTCGCDPRTDLGGVARLATLINRERAAHPQLLLLDLGNNFTLAERQEVLKDQYLAKALTTLRADAALFNKAEWLAREQNLGTRPFLLSNRNGLAAQQAALQRIQDHIRKDDVLILGYFWHTDFKRFLMGWGKELQQKWQTIFEQSKARKKILLFAGPQADLQAIATWGAFDLIVSSNASSESVKPGFTEKENPELLIRLQTPQRVRMVPLAGTGVLRGGALRKGEAPSVAELLEQKNTSKSDKAKGGLFPKQGSLDLPAAPALNSLDAKLFADIPVSWLGKRYDDGSPLSELLQQYENAVASVFTARIQERLKDLAHSPFVGAQACQSCHPQAYKAWQDSKHAQAYKTLELAEKHQDGECVSCHVLGYEEKGGFVSIEKTPHFAGVQCETCHGERKEHIQNPKLKAQTKPAKEVCTSCHHTPHSAAFEIDKYWEQIKHGF